MRVLTINELMRLTRIELTALHARITTDLTALPEASVERANAHVNLCTIRRVLAHRGRNRAQREDALDDGY